MSPSSSIDCAGILKLRNADIELRKGETDIGRKNTRVRLVFRVHIPEASGRVISLQAASNPIECCKWGSGLGRGPREWNKVPGKDGAESVASVRMPLQPWVINRLGLSAMDVSVCCS